ncbi:MAG TPA: glycosyltransferase [Candidatus Nanoarchaeia archaeon]|nr:glycosyltransferase [Candidatus Nanoarchaeia archaeon]
MLDVSVVLPAHNEAQRLQFCVEKVKQTLDELDCKYEIIIAEDGSSDGTDAIAKDLAKRNGFRSLHSPSKLGRGRALKTAFAIARGKTLVYMDIDLATDLKHFAELLEHAKTHDVVTGSRYADGAKTKRPPLRRLVSKVYNLLIRIMLGCNIKDAQCGFKAFSRRFSKEVIENINEKSWAWDTIVLVEAIKHGYKFKEFPVDWVEKKNKFTSVKRIFKDTRLHGLALVKLFLKWRLNKKVRV